MKQKDDLLCALLNCGYLDLDFLLNLTKNYDIDELIDYVINELGETPNVNNLIYATFNFFLRECADIIEEKGIELDPFEDFEIYTNYMDSHICVRYNLEEYQDLVPELNILCNKRLGRDLW